ncbi:hypothetical protein, partial [Pseudomonas syringae]
FLRPVTNVALCVVCAIAIEKHSPAAAACKAWTLRCGTDVTQSTMTGMPTRSIGTMINAD